MQPAPLSAVLLHAERIRRGLVVAMVIVLSSACSSAGAGLTATTPPSIAAPAPPAPPTTTTTPPTTTPPTTTPPTTRAFERARPTSADALAAELTEAERAIRNPTVDLQTGRAWGRRAQRLYATLTDNPTWADEVLTTVGADVADDVELNWIARQNLSALVTSTSLATQLPVWRIDEPLPPDELLGYYHEAEATTGVPWTVLAAINLIETRMGRIEGLSTAGAAGPMQFLPSTWQACCDGDPTVDRDAILGAAVYLEQSGALTDLDGAIFAYNHSDRYVRAVRAYADILARNELAYRGFHGFEVYFLSSAGLLHLAPGYEEPTPVDAATWLAAHPEALVD